MKNLVLIALLLVTASIINAQNCPDGNTAYKNKNYREALEAYSICLDLFPNDSSVVFMNGYSLLMLKKYKESVPFLEKSIKLNYQPTRNTQFALGLAYAALNDEANSLKNLEASAKAGFAGFTRMDSTQYNSIKDTANFNRIRKIIYTNAFPCLKDQNNNKFDFWLGDWDVYVGGQLRAQSKITKAKGGCAVHEDYEVLNGTYSGQSINFYDPTEKKWHQYWVGSSADKSKYYEMEDYTANMQFLTKSINPKGVESWIKMSFTAIDENTVNQDLDSSTDMGKTWTPAFRGVYKRK